MKVRLSVSLAVMALVLAGSNSPSGPQRADKGRRAIFSPQTETRAMVQTPGPGPNGLAQSPTMGWMSWQVFRCEINCTAHPAGCVNEQLYRETADSMASLGYLDAGYDQISIDDCWEDRHGRDSEGHLVPDPTRFPRGMAALGSYIHAKGFNFGTYSDEGTATCCGYPASKGYEAVDASTFAHWGVDYLKLDGCNNDQAGYAKGYPAMGTALQASGRNIAFSCSWPAYLGDNESEKPFADMIDAGCNSWRNWEDIQCTWASVSSIISHWAEYGHVMAPFAGPGHWHDMDMLVIGAGCLSHDEEQTQMAIWAISASPLIMGNDVRRVPKQSRELLLNRAAIAVSQDRLGRMGTLLPGFNASSKTQVWARPLSGGDVAVALFNKADKGAVSIILDFASVGLQGQVSVFDIWAQARIGIFYGRFVADAVPPHGTAFLKLTVASAASAAATASEGSPSMLIL